MRLPPGLLGLGVLARVGPESEVFLDGDGKNIEREAHVAMFSRVAVRTSGGMEWRCGVLGTEGTETKVKSRLGEGEFDLRGVAAMRVRSDCAAMLEEEAFAIVDPRTVPSSLENFPMLR